MGRPKRLTNYEGIYIVLMLVVFSIHQSMKAPELKEKLHESEKLIQEMTVTWEEKLRKTEEIATVCPSVIIQNVKF